MAWTVWGSDAERLAAGAYDGIGECVCWLARTFGSDTPGRCVPRCWPQHPDLVAEAADVQHTWRAAFLSASTADTAKPGTASTCRGFLGRVDAYLTRDCLTEQHRPQLPAPAPCRARRPVAAGRHKVKQARDVR